MSRTKVFLVSLLAVILLSVPALLAAPLPQSGAARNSAAAGTVVSKDKLDINTASRDALIKLPGITDTYAAKIIAGRPYKMKTELVRREILPPSVYDGIRDLIIAHRPKK